MINTLRLTRFLRDRGWEQDKAEALAEGLDDELRAELATRDDLHQVRERLHDDLEQMRKEQDRLRQWVRDELDRQFWRIVAGVALLLLANLGATWGIVATYAKLAR